MQQFKKVVKKPQDRASDWTWNDFAAYPHFLELQLI